VLHEAVANKLKDQTYVPNFYELFEANGLTQTNQDLVQLTETYYDNWLSHQDFKELPIDVEVEKEINHPELGLIVGKIDAIYKNNSNVTIVDHKFMTNTDKHKDGLQMAVYSLLVPEATAFQYEKIGLDTYAVQKVRSLEGSLKKINTIVNNIKQGEFTATPQEWFIPYCPFLKECGKCLSL